MTTIKTVLLWLPDRIRDLLVRWLASGMAQSIENQRSLWNADREAYKDDLDQWVANLRHQAQQSLENLRVGQFDSGKVTPANRTPYTLFDTDRMGHIGVWLGATGHLNPGDQITIRCFTYTEDGEPVLTSTVPMGPGAIEIPFAELQGKNAISVPEFWAPYGGKIEVTQDYGQGMDLSWAAYCR